MSLFFTERRETPFPQRGESVYLLYREEAGSVSIERRVYAAIVYASRRALYYGNSTCDFMQNTETTYQINNTQRPSARAPPHGRPQKIISGCLGQAFHDEKIQPSGAGKQTIQVSPATHDQTHVRHLHTCICEPPIETFT